MIKKIARRIGTDCEIPEQRMSSDELEKFMEKDDRETPAEGHELVLGVVHYVTHLSPRTILEKVGTTVY